MSGEDKHSCNGEKHASDEKLAEGSEVGVDSSNIVQMFPSSSEITNENLEERATEVNSSDVIAVEQLSHESLTNDFGENLECRVVYEFPSDYESEHDSHLFQTCDDDIIHENSEVFEHNNENPPFLPVIKTEDKLVEVVDIKTLNKDAPDVACDAGNWKGPERKRKNSTDSLPKNKKHKEVPGTCDPVIQISHHCDIEQVDDFGYVSGELADTEDNVKDSTSSDSSDSNSSNEIVISLNNLASGIQKSNSMKSEAIDENIFGKINQNVASNASSSRKKPIEEHAVISLFTSSLKGEILPVFKFFDETDAQDNSKESTSSDSRDFNSSNKRVIPKNLVQDIQKAKEMRSGSINEDKSVKINQNSNSLQKKSIEENAMKSLFPTSLKGETLPPFKLSDESKKRFEKSMPTIFEVRESSSNEQILQPSQSKTNPLKMKTKVVKRKDKCNVCNVRLGLCAIQCRCGGYYCAKHRYDKEHNCTFDYKSMGAAEIRKNNPKITAEKIRKL